MDGGHDMTWARPSPPPLHECDLGGIARPMLCVIVDTEEDFDWGGPFSRRHVRVTSLPALARGHAIFRRYGLQPTYLMDYPVIDHASAADIFGPWLAAGECLIGAQLHPWVTPPHEEVVCAINSYPCNLDPDLQRRKLAALTHRIEEVLGQPPRIYKAGRYGLDLSFEQDLLALGYRVDTSVLPFRDNSGVAGGPDFYDYPGRPFWTDPGRGLFYLPVTQSVLGPLRRVARGAVGRWIFSAGAAAWHLPGVLARTHLLERIMLSPEGASADEMRRLTRSMFADGHRVFALSLHSPSLVPGGTPYVRTERDLDSFLSSIERFLAFFFGQLGGIATDPLALRRLFESGPTGR